MTARDLDVRWNLAGVTAPAGESSFQVTAPARATGPEFLAKLVVQSYPGEQLIGIPENPFVPLPHVAARVRPFGVQHVAGAFIVPPGTMDGLRALFTELECECVWMTFGGVESVERLTEAVRPRRWWQFTKARPTTGPASGLNCLLAYSASHNSLEVLGERGLVLEFFDHLRDELRDAGGLKGR